MLNPPPVHSPVDQVAGQQNAQQKRNGQQPPVTQQNGKPSSLLGTSLTSVWMQWFNALYTYLTATNNNAQFNSIGVGVAPPGVAGEAQVLSLGVGQSPSGVTGEARVSNITGTGLTLGPGQLQAVYGSGSAWYNTFLRNDGSNVYLLQSAVQTTQVAAINASFNTYKPFSWNLTTGAVTIDGTGLGCSFGGAINVTGAVNAGTNISFGSGGTSIAGSIYSDATWGCIVRAKTAATTYEWGFQNSAGTLRNYVDTSGNFVVAGTGAVLLHPSGDIYAYRSGGTTGVIFLNSAGSAYLYYDGTNYQMPTGAAIYRAGQVVWDNGNSPISAAANGYQKLASGLIIQWGTTAAFTGATSNVITLPVAFPTACQSVVYIPTTSVNVAVSSPAVTAKSTTSFTMWANQSGSSAYNWIAIGY